MNKQLFELIQVNLRYAKPQSSHSVRNSRKSGKRFTRYIIIQYLILSLLFLLFYGFQTLHTNYSRLPGLFTYSTAMFSLAAFSQGILTTYNIFFESQDLKGYLPLPFKQSQIFLAKFLVVTLTMLPFTLPLLAIFILAGIQAKNFPILAIFLAVLLFCLWIVLLFMLCSVIVFGLTRTKFFQKHKKSMVSLLFMFAITFSVIGVTSLPNQSSQSTLFLPNHHALRLFLPFFYSIVQPLSLLGSLSFLGIIGMTLLIIWIMKQFFLPQLYNQLLALSAIPNVHRRNRSKKNHTLRHALKNYHLQLIRDPNLLIQIFLYSVFSPLLFVIFMGISGHTNLSQLSLHYWGLLILVGCALATLTINSMSLVANIISMDKENFLFIHSLPLSFRYYLQTKFYFACILQLIVNGGLVLAGGLFFQLPLVLLLCLFIGNLVSSYLLSEYYFIRDHRLLALHWTNINQLFARGWGTFGLVFRSILILISSLLILLGYTILLVRWPSLFIEILPILIVALVFTLLHAHFKNNFWKNL